MSKKRSNGLLAGIGIGAGLIGIGATAGALVLAHKKAKEHDQTTAEYIKGKARNVVNKVMPKKLNTEICPCCGLNEEDCVCDQLNCFDDLDESINYSNEPDLFEIDDDPDDDVNSEDALARAIRERDESIRERNEWKARYEALIKSLTDDENNENN